MNIRNIYEIEEYFFLFVCVLSFIVIGQFTLTCQKYIHVCFWALGTNPSPNPTIVNW